MTFFFRKKVLKCHCCNPVTEKVTKYETKIHKNILLSVIQLSSNISVFLKKKIKIKLVK